MTNLAHNAFPVRRIAVSIGLLSIPVFLSAQEAVGARYGLATAPAHADHADLHRPAATDAGAELAAVRLLGMDDAATLCRAAELAMTVGLLTDPERDSARLAWFRQAEAYARQAVALRPDDPDALFMEGAALGLQASYGSLGSRVRRADRILATSRRILEIDPDHPGGHHLLGRLTAAGMRVNPVARFLVGRVMGGDLLKGASWERAETSLLSAVAAEPDNPMHRLELAALYRDTDRPEDARVELRTVLAFPDTSVLVAYYKDQARSALRRLP